MEIHVLYLGKMEFPRLRLVDCKDETEMIQSPAAALLIKHPTLGNLLYDTGNSPDYRRLYTPEMLEEYPITEFISITDALAEKGLTPGDIDGIILSHLHFDHAGGLSCFAGTKALNNVMVAEEDLNEARRSTAAGEGGAYIRALFDIPGIRFHPIRETTALADDLTLFIQKAHTPGVIGLILRTSRRGVILATSDTIYTRDSYEKGIPPGGHINKTPEEFYANLDRVRTLEEKLEATLFFGHDYAQVRQWSAESPLI